ncbi:hypothetical protein BD560DRAFT_406957 [Blakeslea trispora]|nr:hypothetical protein BD560DRAFT_406957 [Blakeslea trispora]
MEKLPQELSHYVLSLLSHSDRLQCSLVCKCWKLILDRSGVLLETLQCQNDRQLEVAMKYFSRHPDLSLKVKRIEINKPGLLPRQFIAQQSLLFTALQHIELYFQPADSFCHTPGSRKYAVRTESLTFDTDFLNQQLKGMLAKQPYWTQLQTISETSPSMYTVSILGASSAPFNYLHSLWLNFALIPPTYVSLATQNLVKSLQNAPALRQIHLMYVLIGRAELDVLHTSCPKLESIAIYKSSLDIYLEESGQSLGVLPAGHQTTSAPSVTKVSFLEAKISHPLSLFSYISYKYPYLTDLVCRQQQHSHWNTISRMDNHSALKKLAFSCPRLIHLDTNLFSFTLEAYKAFDLHCKDFQLESFSFSDDYYGNMQSFDVVSNSHFRHTVKHISIESMQYEWMDISKRLSQFTHLTHINIEDSLDQKEPTAFRVPLDLVLSEHQHLETLCIRDCFIYRASKAACSSSVQKLSLLNVTLNASKDGSSQSIMDLIALSCPKLHHLHIHGDTYSCDSKLTLDLRGCSQLNSLDIYLWSFNKICLQVDGEPEKWLEIQLSGDEYGTERVEAKRHEDPPQPSSSSKFFDVKLAHAIPKFYQDEFQNRLYEENYAVYY